MKESIERMIIHAEQNNDYELADIIRQILFELADTINCPSNWRSIGEEFAEKYSNNDWIMDNCNLYEYV
jgi:hypothetical protein